MMLTNIITVAFIVMHAIVVINAIIAMPVNIVTIKIIAITIIAMIANIHEYMTSTVYDEYMKYKSNAIS